MRNQGLGPSRVGVYASGAGSSGLTVQGSGSGFKVQGFGSRVRGLGFRVVPARP